MASQQLPVQTLKLKLPPLEELCTVLEKALKSAFKNASVKVVDCPDLEQKPFGLAAKGLCGQSRIANVGGVKYLAPLPRKEKKYNLDDVAHLAQLPGAFIIGAGAGPYHVVGVNSEFMGNIRTSSTGNAGKNHSYIAKIDQSNGGCNLFQLPENKEFAILFDCYLSEGKSGKVLEVKASHRIKETNLVTEMRKALKSAYGDEPVGIGGVFLIQKGNAKLHIMPDFSSTPLTTSEQIDKWLQYYDMKAPLVCLSSFVSHDPGLDIRVEHTHCFSNHGEGGHYHHDTTPEQVDYLGYFSPAEIFYRIDKP